MLLLLVIKDDPETAGFEAIDSSPAKGAPPPLPPPHPGAVFPPQGSARTHRIFYCHM